MAESRFKGSGQVDIKLHPSHGHSLEGDVRAFLAMKGNLLDPQIDVLVSGKGLRLGDGLAFNTDLTLRAKDRILRLPLLEFTSPQWSYRGTDCSD